ncbi:MAG: hypothetical protein KBS43_03195 [Oscillospiraceae bacterium]|nr:hypothetical protein [Candidatus Limimonas coprohippi]
MLRISNIKMPVDHTEDDVKNSVAKVLKADKNAINDIKIFKRSIDSRRKDDIHFVYTVDVTADVNEAKILKASDPKKVSESVIYKYPKPENKRTSKLRPVVVGFGPAGMFCALMLAREGLCPLVIERGADVDQRTRDVHNFWDTRKLNTESNVQFGEGGAGTFSDGKLTTGIKDARQTKIFEEFIRFGAPEQIMYSNYPHIGTDKLVHVVKNLREEILSLGGEIHFGAKLTDLIIYNNFIQGITYTENGRSIDFETDTVVLAIGHSARDTVEMLYDKGINMIQKPFSVGTRIEHPREFIDEAQYGKFAGHPALGAANYKMACHPEHGRGTYTFCMCPGGTVVAASSEEGMLVVNGMSEYARDKENSNSALLVGINPEDFPSEHPLAGMHLQRQIESKAFELGGKDYTAPCQLVKDFLNNEKSTKLGAIKPSCPTGTTPSDIREILPQKVTDNLADALLKMNNMLKGFAMPEAVLTAPESRSSSPVRIIRDDFYQCSRGDTPLGGLYPCGEGAGYAGGIVSAAVDGIRCFEAILSNETPFV